MLEILKAIGLVILSLSILVTIHELGHFWAARLFKIRVDVFSLFFPPKLFSWKRGDVSWQIGSIPLGGYVKISGMIDESMDKEFLDKAPEPWEFRAKPVWQRFIVMIGGIVMNIVLGVVIYSIIKFTYGDLRVPISETEKYPVYSGQGSLAERIGFKTGDIFLNVNGTRPKYFENAAGQEHLLEDGVFYEVKRAGEPLRLNVPDNLIDSLKHYKRAAKSALLFNMALPPVVKVPEQDEKNKVLPVFGIGLQTGDTVKSLAGIEVAYFNDISGILESHGNDEVEISFTRPGLDSTFVSRFKPYLRIAKKDTTPVIGIGDNIKLLTDTLNYGFFSAIGVGFKEAFGVFYTQVLSYKKMAEGNVSFSENVQGPIGIFLQLVDGFNAIGWKFFWGFTAFISMALAFANILPIPALDGGHIVFLLIEAVTGRPPSEKVRIYAQYVGMVILLLLMVFIFYNDFRRIATGE